MLCVKHTGSGRGCLDRRRLLALSATTATLAASVKNSLAALGADAATLGVRPDSPDDQSRVLQRAIDQAAGARIPLVLPPGVYRAGDLRLPTGTRLIGIRGATRLVLAGDKSLVSADNADDVSLCDLVLDGGARPLPEGRGLVHLTAGRGIRIETCDILGSGRHGIVCEQIEGEILRNTISGAADAALHLLDARGLAITGNTVRGAGNNGILVWRSQSGDDGTFVVDNRIEEIFARAGGSGQNGNAINVFRAGNVIVRGNRVRGAAFSAVRGNAASNLQVIGNSCTGVGEVALYAEFAFEGAVIANNTVDGAAIGVSVTNSNEGGRLAVVQGNLIRNLTPKRPAGADPEDAGGIGVGVEADTAVTGNVIENAPTAGIFVGWGRNLRDVAVTGNTVRRAGIGVAVSVVPGAGAAVITGNMIAETTQGAVVGMEWKRAVTGDLTRGDTRRFDHLTIEANRVRL